MRLRDLLFASLALLGCARKDAPSVQVTEGGVVPAPSATTKTTTTSSSIALGNLTADLNERLRKNDKAPQARLTVVELSLALAQATGAGDALDRASSIATDAVTESPKAWQAHLAKALVQGAVHQFDAANASLDTAAKLGAPAGRVSEARFANLLAVGRYDDAAAILGKDVESRDASTIASAAVLAGRMQKIDEAERLFELAKKRYRDVSPFPVAWMAFQRASVLEAAGRDGRPYYAEACEALPEHAHAAVHVAPTEPADKAVARLEALHGTNDPDVMAALGVAYERAGKADRARSMVDEARTTYEQRLRDYPAAYADHAARFFLAKGADPKRALALAKANAKIRSTEEAIDLWSAAAAANASDEELCASAKAMRALRYVSERSKQLASASLSRCKG